MNLKDDFARARGEFRPPEGAYQRLLRRRERKRRNNRITAGVLGLVIASGVIVTMRGVLIERDRRGRPASSCLSAPTHAWSGDGTGADTVDGRPATLHGNAAFGPGLVGEAFELDGIGDFVSIPDDHSLDFGSGHFTVSLWVNFDTTDGEQILIEKWVQASFEPEGVIGWTLTKLGDDHIGFATVDGFSVDSPPLNLPPGTWIHLVARRDRDRFELLMNGEVVASRTVPSGMSLDLDSPSSLKFGHRGSPDDTPGSISHQGFFLNGRIDEVKLFVGRALSNREINVMLEKEASGQRC
jgi:Concanavalin A-like lectin/glucanases superfamily